MVLKLTIRILKNTANSILRTIVDKVNFCNELNEYKRKSILQYIFNKKSHNNLIITIYIFMDHALNSIEVRYTIILSENVTISYVVCY